MASLVLLGACSAPESEPAPAVLPDYSVTSPATPSASVDPRVQEIDDTCYKHELQIRTKYGHLLQDAPTTIEGYRELGAMLLDSTTRDKTMLEEQRQLGGPPDVMAALDTMIEIDAQLYEAAVGANLALTRDDTQGFWDHLDSVDDSAYEPTADAAGLPACGSGR